MDEFLALYQVIKMRRYRIIKSLLMSVILVFCLSSCKSYDIYFEGENIIMEGERYILTGGYFDSEDDSFCKVDGYKVYRIVGDSNMTYLYIHSFTDGALYVKEDYCQTHEKITAIINGNYRSAYYESDVINFFSTIKQKGQFDISFSEYENHYSCITTFAVQYDNQPVSNESYKVFVDDNKCIFFNNERRGCLVEGTDEVLLRRLCQNKWK